MASVVDYAIIGGGISGLYAAIHLAKKYPDARIAIYEKYNVLGGRVQTYTGNIEGADIQWEKGAGRIHESHTIMRGLLKEYGLRELPLSPEMYWKKTYTSPLIPNPFEESLKLWLPEVKKLDKGYLEMHTLYEVLRDIFGAGKAIQLTKPFPYFGEVYTLRADLAIQSFTHEMGTHDNYFYSPDGYSKLIQYLVITCEAYNVKVNTNWELIEALPSPKATLWFATGPLKLKEKRKIVEVRAVHTIFALPQLSLQKIQIFKDLPLLSYVKMLPLQRIYAIFPKPWFIDIPRFSTETPLRYFIPIDPAQGIVMISYTDGDDTIPWMSIDYGAEPKEETLARLLTEECRKLFPEKDIPYPTILKSYPWDDGCSYWKPGRYDPKEISRQSLQPFGPSIKMYICGESFSMKQAWMEGALENTQDLLRIL